MRIPPVVLLLLAFAVSAALAAVDPLARPSDGTRVAGALLALAGAAVALAGVVAFRRRRTTVDPFHPERATTLVDDGVYRWTRNPMYAGLVLAGVGAAAWLGSALALAGPALLAVLLDRWQIAAEERALGARFGASYDAYARTVRRWVGRFPPAD